MVVLRRLMLRWQLDAGGKVNLLGAEMAFGHGGDVL